MHQTASYMDMQPGPHISSGPTYSHSAPAAPMGHYPQYQQASVMPPAPSHYGAHPSYSGYGYGAPQVASPQSAGGQPVQQQGIQLPAMMPAPSPQHSYVPANPAPTPSYPSQQSQVPFDTTGQIAPPGMKPRVTATLWEDEGSLCFQVEAKGVCVARREDNHFINGTKLLNVAGMTRGRRDGILKSEKLRHVVKIGPMHLKGVWIPFERALDFANKEKITDLLYPLFVHNIGGLLYNENAPRTTPVGAQAAADQRRRLEGDASRHGGSGQPPALQHTHSMPSISGQAPPTPHSLAANSTAPRPGIDRAHTFPTPPTSASSVPGMNGQGAGYEWGTHAIPNGVNGGQPLSIDTGLSNARSLPNTPATTPPGNSQQQIHSYNQQGYDGQKHYYNATSGSQNNYPSHPDSARYGQSLPPTNYGKSDMGPPATLGSQNGPDPHDHKSDGYGPPHHGEHDAGEHHDSGYLSAGGAPYGSGRDHYSYQHVPSHQHLSPEMTGSPSQPNNSGRGTPRTMAMSQPQWSQDYHTPPRTASSGTVYNAMGNTRSSNPSTDNNYASSAYSGASHSTGMTSVKRGREDDDQDRPASRDYDGSYDAKRRKVGRQEPFGMPLNAPPHMQAIKTGGQR